MRTNLIVSTNILHKRQITQIILTSEKAINTAKLLSKNALMLWNLISCMKYVKLFVQNCISSTLLFNLKLNFEYELLQIVLKTEKL